MDKQENRLSIGRINGVEIFAYTNEKGETMVPIKPICTVLGISPSSQREKIQEDDFYESTELLSSSVGADGKTREMFCIQLRDVYGWMASINSKNVAPEARESVKRYRRQCYDLIYDRFFGRNKRMQEYTDAERETINRIQRIDNKLKEIELSVKELKSERAEAKASLDKIRSARLDDQPSLFD